MATYVFKATLQEEKDGRWSAWIDVLPGCAVWGYTRDEALRELREGAELYIEDMLDCGEEVPFEEIEEDSEPTVTAIVEAISA